MNKVNKMKCQGKNKAGEPCGLKAKWGKKYCHHHLPESAISNKPDPNMRVELCKMEENRDTFVGAFKRVGSKPGGYTTILLTDIFNLKDPTKILSDHSWFNFTKGFSELGHLTEGDLIQFCARVKKYEKSADSGGKTFDYKFSMPLGIQFYHDIEALKPLLQG